MTYNVNNLSSKVDNQQKDNHQVLSTVVTKADLCNTKTCGGYILYSKDETRLLKFGRKLQGSYTVKAGTKAICNYAFTRCNIRNINFPDSLLAIGHNCFFGCSDLNSIFFPNNLLTIGYNAFFGCTDLISINLAKNLENVGSNAFLGCFGLKHIYVRCSDSDDKAAILDKFKVLFPKYLHNRFEIMCLK